MKFQVAMAKLKMMETQLTYQNFPEDEWKYKALELMALSYRILAQFLWHEATRSISTPPGRDATPSQVTAPQFVRFPQQFAGTH